MLHDWPSVDEWHRGVRTSVRLPALFGIAVLLAWSVGFGAWASLAPLEGAVVAAGSFVPTGQNKQVQHLEGGIVREMLVKEGDLVDKGQLLLRLDDTASKASSAASFFENTACSPPRHASKQRSTARTRCRCRRR